ncbi:micrococcal nuclease [Thermosyntropha lipolytica DSM 11003]|uniref:Micrococcal nuclease n=1 Tax=Thermosyntropha lipolytica DSM 11003 TaxID=1123382 RepID=A0A1M5RDM2_9FIRM|nr:thermonuclease family protein [Thermosyntropha lipolytica]SHH24381.1 micrococcal nuclease [Thermosyntropha lipolytica DSM 11003]
MQFRRWLAFFYLVVFFLLILAGCVSRDNTYQVLRVVDGDTIIIDYNGKEERVRFIGVDTPETKHPQKGVEFYGREAYEFTRNLLEGERVTLKFDVQERDRYGRLLAYVYKDDIFVNELLVKEGYARVLTIPPNVKYAEHFLKLEREARKEGRGLWGKEVAEEKKEITYIGNKNSKKFHLPSCEGVAKMKEENKVNFNSLDEAYAAGYSPCSICNPQ